jgi:hypothetical protein
MNSATLRTVAGTAMATTVLLGAAACSDTSPASPRKTSSARQQTPTAETRTTQVGGPSAMGVDQHVPAAVPALCRAVFGTAPELR